MKHLSFGWVGPGLLREELYRPTKSISAQFGHPAWRGASAVTLWRADGTGLRIFTQMHDVLPRLEVGVLNFELTSSPIPGEQIADLDDRFIGALTISKLSVTESGVIADSGIVLKCKDEIAIVAGGFPLTLALKGIEFDFPAFEPEYPWDRYEQSELFRENEPEGKPDPKVDIVS